MPCFGTKRGLDFNYPMIETNPYSKGSEWRKWDLQVHTPASALNNGFGSDWDVYVQRLFKTAIENKIAVVGITDYFHIEGYKKVKAILADATKMATLFTEEERVAISKILVLANVEFRLFPINGSRLNFHVIFSDSVSVRDIEDNFLHNLNFVREGRPFEPDEKSKLKLGNLEELGKKLKAEHEPFRVDNDLFVGMKNAVVSDEEISEMLSARPSAFAGKYVLAMPCDEDLSTIPWDGQDHNTRKKMIQKSNFFLSSNSNTIEWGLGKKHAKPEDFKAEFKSYKPCLWSSDAHDYDKLFEPDEKRYCWVKADPTFAGLRQIINEPEQRVFVGEVPPNYKYDHLVIQKISIPKSNGWFEENLELELNRDLVTVIGGRGSGKSALAEMIAYGGGSWSGGEEAFVTKASEHVQSIEGTEITLTWGDGHTTSFKIGEDQGDEKSIRYLSQNEIERLCSHKNSKILLEQIESVIFQALDETERMGTSSFAELTTNKLKGFKLEKEQETRRIKTAAAHLASLLTAIQQKPEKEKLLRDKQAELKKLTESLPVLPAEDKKGQDELASLLAVKTKFDEKIIGLQTKATNLSEVATKITLFRTDITKFEKDINVSIMKLLPDFGTFSTSIDTSKIEEAIKKENDQIAKDLKTLRNGNIEDSAALLSVATADLPFPNSEKLAEAIKTKQEETKASETVKLKYQLQKKTIGEVETVIKSIEVEVKKINEESTPESEKAKTECQDAYCAYIEILQREKTELEKLYEPLQRNLQSGTETNKRLEFEARLHHEVENHAERGLAILDRNKKGNFKDKPALKAALEKFWSNVKKENYSSEKIKEELSTFDSQFNTYEGKPKDVQEQLRAGYGLEDFYGWLFDPSNVDVRSTINFDKTDLYLLSPGKKGIVLLILFLQIDGEDNRPLIIDQPEENLDNLSVYQDLITFFKERKQYRQIIIITHNPNLVVNTDAEQVVVADYDGGRNPRIRYSAGSLENQAAELPGVELEDLEDGIIEQVCKILEGGETAFESRKKKYELSVKSFKN
jgi:energy-coupling factor transporter ATP-binding protein EcfA2